MVSLTQVQFRSQGKARKASAYSPRPQQQHMQHAVFHLRARKIFSAIARIHRRTHPPSPTTYSIQYSNTCTSPQYNRSTTGWPLQGCLHTNQMVVAVVSRPTEMNLTDSEGICTAEISKMCSLAALARVWGLLERRPDRPAGRWSGVQTDQRPVVDLLYCGLVLVSETLRTPNRQSAVWTAVCRARCALPQVQVSPKPPPNID